MRSLTIAMCSTLVLAVGACGSDGPSTSPSGDATAASKADRVRDRHDLEVDEAVAAMERAAAARRPSKVAEAQRRLDELAAADPDPQARSTARDPFTRVVDEFRFKQAPLYVRQITSADGDHRLYVSVDRNAFCLKTPAARLAAADGVYAPADRRLRRGGVTDFEFVLVPLAQTPPTRKQALAVGTGGRLRLTRRGRDCRTG